MDFNSVFESDFLLDTYQVLIFVIIYIEKLKFESFKILCMNFVNKKFD